MTNKTQGRENKAPNLVDNSLYRSNRPSWPNAETYKLRKQVWWKLKSINGNRSIHTVLTVHDNDEHYAQQALFFGAIFSSKFFLKHIHINIWHHNFSGIKSKRQYFIYLTTLWLLPGSLTTSKCRNKGCCIALVDEKSAYIILSCKTISILFTKDIRDKTIYIDFLNIPTV